jgi:beta-galactosidase/beta-glucuronidase
MKEVWYRREIEITPEQLQNRVILHFGAADYLTTVFINGEQAGTHEGGYTPFHFDVTGQLRPGANTVTVRCEDDHQGGLNCIGKQSDRPESYGCLYTRTTGIWQTVWLEFVPEKYIISAIYQPDPENDCLHVRAKVHGRGTLNARAFWHGKPVGRASAVTSGNLVRLQLPLSETHLWEVGKGGLYDLQLTFGDDKVQSYFGLRSLRLDGFQFLINEKSVFQRLVLDQGYYPDGIYTAPTAEALENDIKLAMAAGFNGARLHEKVFEPLFLYYCDLHGYLAWGEFPNWGGTHQGQGNDSRPEFLAKMLPQWRETIDRDRNHPSIVGWCPLNETSEGQLPENIIQIYEITKRLDPDRPCIDTSGYVHVKTDIFDVHDYEQDPAIFARHFADFIEGDSFYDWKQNVRKKQQYGGEAMFVSEYGGIGWDAKKLGGLNVPVWNDAASCTESWGYGEGPQTEEEFRARYEGLTNVLLDHPKIFGFCYTQLYDIEQEQNGLYMYDRSPKFDMAFFKRVNERRAAIEN